MADLENPDDSKRAMAKDQKKGPFGVSAEQLQSVVKAYQQRTYVEDLEVITEQLGGIQQIMAHLKTSPDQGIQLDSKEARDKQFGSNKRPVKERTTFYELLCEQLEDFMLRLLIVCAIFALVTEMVFADPGHRNVAWIEGVSILLAVAFVSCFGAGSDYNKETQFIKQQEQVHRTETVWIRRGKDFKEENRDELSVGDVVMIKAGMGIPVDGIVLEAKGVMVDESAMTGESDHLPRDSYDACLAKQKIHESEHKGGDKHPHYVPSPVLLSGTSIQTGEGMFLVTVVGDMSCEGQINASLDEGEDDKTPLQEMLNIIATDIGKLGMFCAILIFHALVLRNFIEGMVRKDFDLFGGEFDEEMGEKCRYRYETAPALWNDVSGVFETSTQTSGLWIDTLTNAQAAAWETFTTANPTFQPTVCKPDIYGALTFPNCGFADFASLEDYLMDKCPGEINKLVSEWLGHIITGVAIVVVAVPEGLPLAVMLSLAYSVKKMLEDANFVKKLTSCEVMGGANNICSDKTGTLTQNIMTLTRLWQGGDIEIDWKTTKGEKKDDPVIQIIQTDKTCIKNQKVADLIAVSVICNSIGDVNESGATDKAMFKLVDGWGYSTPGIREQYPEGGERFQFDSTRKRMATIIEYPELEYPKRMFTKGASELIIENCTHYLDEQGNEQEITDEMRNHLLGTVEKYAEQALRTVALAYRDLKPGMGGQLHDDMSEINPKLHAIEVVDRNAGERGFTLVAIAGIMDIIRDTVPSAVQTCKGAGVRVRMVTGDNIVTAKAIAKNCGILEDKDLNEKYVCMLGPDFQEFIGGMVDNKGRPVKVLGKDVSNEKIKYPENMAIIRQKLKVLARSSPQDKYVLVAGLSNMGDIVAVTGDGTNDAPALKRANVGFAMKTGTQVAHHACDIEIMDDDFSSIVKACSWGRNVYDNIRRFLQFQLTVNVCALVIAFVGGVIMAEAPLTAIQFLWVNMIMDTLAALALATEDPKPELLERPPYRKGEYIISRKMLKHILGQTFFQMGIIFAFVFGAPKFVPEYWEDSYGEHVPNVPVTAVFPNGDEPYWDIIAVDRDTLVNHANPKYSQWDGKYVLDGTPSAFDGTPAYYPLKDASYSRHLTTVFNIFVFFQICNMICSRKIQDQLNVLDGVFSNWLFGLIWVVIIAGQCIMVQLAGRVMNCHRNGLTGKQWLITTLPALSAFFFNFILKFIPDKVCDCIPIGEEDPEAVEKAMKEFNDLKEGKI